jgi:hypothetical protein
MRTVRLFVGLIALPLVFGASARPDSLVPSGPIAIIGKSGVVVRGLRITSTSGNCVTIANSSDIAIEGSEIGPCGDSNTTNLSNGVSIVGGDHIAVSDNYIHVENAASACCDTHDNILVQGSSYVAIQGNVIAYGETNIEVNGMPNDHVAVVGNFLLNPRGPFPRGQNYQSWGVKDVGPNTNMLVSENYALSARGLDRYRFSENQEDSINFGYTAGAVARANYVVGGHSPSGCGLIADDHADNMQFTDNILSDTGQCGIGIASGAGQTVVGNKILNLTPIPKAGNTPIYVWNQYKAAACGPVTVSNNIGDEIKADGATHSGFWNGGGCGAVTMKNNIWSAEAHAELYPMSTTNPPPMIPVRPKTCVAASPFTTNKSLPSCDASSAPPSASAQP